MKLRFDLNGLVLSTLLVSTVAFCSGCGSPGIRVTSRKPVLTTCRIGTLNSYQLRPGDVILIDPNTKRAEKFRTIPIPASEVTQSTIPFIEEPYPMELRFEHEEDREIKEKQFIEDAVSRSTYLVLSGVRRISVEDEWKFVDRVIEPGIKRDNFIKDFRFLLVTSVFSASSASIKNQYMISPSNDGNRPGAVMRIAKEEFKVYFDLPLNDFRDFFQFRVFKLEEDRRGDIVFKPENLYQVKLEEFTFAARP